MSQPSLEEVQAAVRSVLLDRAERPKPKAQAAPARADRDRRADVFAGRLLALRHAESLPDQTREVRVTPGTVITPLARDLLKRRGIEVRLVSRSEVASVRREGEWGFAIELESGLVSAIRRSLLDDLRSWAELDPSVDAAARWVAEGDDRGAMLVTEEASVAVWKACQFPEIRAATAVDVESVVRGVRRLGTNLLVVEPAGKSIALIRHMGLAFRQAGAPQLPEELSDVQPGPSDEDRFVESVLRSMQPPTMNSVRLQGQPNLLGFPTW